jgi:hypothetical protein
VCDLTRLHNLGGRALVPAVKPPASATRASTASAARAPPAAYASAAPSARASSASPAAGSSSAPRKPSGGRHIRQVTVVKKRPCLEGSQ